MLAQDCAHGVLRSRDEQEQRSPWCGGNQDQRLDKKLLDLVKCSLAPVTLGDLCILPQEFEYRFADGSELRYEPIDVL